MLQTLWVRIDNNRVTHKTTDGRHVDSVGPWYSFFNHSCEPNVNWIPVDGIGGFGRISKDMFAVRDVKEGEELYIDHVKFEGGDTMAERYKRIQPWIGMKDCGCVRCRREN